MSMATQMMSFLLFVSLVFACQGEAVPPPPVICKFVDTAFKRSDFPENFIFGAGTSAYQCEGAWNEDGRCPSIWDDFVHKHPQKIKDRSTGDVAVDQYHLYKEDMDILKEVGMGYYRFSISWSRIIPSIIDRAGKINMKGIIHYNDTINYIKSKGLEPFVTLFQFDSPLAFEDQYEGFLNHTIVGDFRFYADVCFKYFGDRVKHWVTFNEPKVFAANGYASGRHAPGRCSSWMDNNCTGGDSGREPYIVGHNQLLAHAEAVKLYRDEFQVDQRGFIGITLNSFWYLPLNETNPDDIDAAARVLAFVFGWFMDPLTTGDYPSIMKALVGDRLPTFTKEESAMIKGSFDFIGINYYTSNYAYNVPHNDPDRLSYLTDPRANTTAYRNGVPIGPPTGSPWLFVYPDGLKKLLLYTKEKYNNPIIYIIENGVSQYDNGSLPIEEALKDYQRIDYHKQHLLAVKEATRERVDVRGYFVWSLLDNFEWAAGYTVRFGLNYVNRTDMTRYKKCSAYWFEEFLSSNGYESF